MKQIPTANYKVRVRDQQWEMAVDDEPDPEYAGIYELDLNNGMVGLMFVPMFERTTQNWPPPTDLFVIHDSKEPSFQGARWLLAALSRYVVTPDAERAGSEDVLPNYEAPDLPADGRRIVFYVTPEEFATYCAELENDFDFLLPPFWTHPHVSDLRHLRVIQLLEDRLLAHPDFRDADLYWLQDTGESIGSSSEEAELYEYQAWLRLWLSAREEGATPEDLRTYAQGVEESRNRCAAQEKQLDEAKRSKLRKWAQEHAREIPELEKRYDAAGGRAYESQHDAT